MKQCRKVSDAISQRMPLSAEVGRHLFTCFTCQKFVRAVQVLGLLSEFRQPSVVVPKDFVERVMNGLTKEEESKNGSVMTALRWAAAILIISMAVGCGFSIPGDFVSNSEQVTSVIADYAPVDEVATLNF